MRYEKKFPFSRDQFLRFLLWKKQSGVFFRKAYPSRVVNNVYFDSIDLLAFTDNETGISKRKKLRLRWYGADSVPSSFRLELKYRQADLGGKLVQKIRGFNLDSIKYSKEFTDLIKNQITGEMLYNFKMYNRPLLYNVYDREYYAYHNVRLTIDTKMRFKRLHPFSLNKTRLTSSSIYSVVELKYNEEDVQLVKKLCRDFEGVKYRHSKYVTALENI